MTAYQTTKTCIAKRYTSLMLAASAEHTINDASTPVAWSAWERPGLHGVQLGAATQKVLGSKGDFVNLDWGHLHLASPTKAELYAGSANASRKAFAATGTVPATADARQPREQAELTRAQRRPVVVH